MVSSASISFSFSTAFCKMVFLSLFSSSFSRIFSNDSGISLLLSLFLLRNFLKRDYLVSSLLDSSSWEDKASFFFSWDFFMKKSLILFFLGFSSSLGNSLSDSCSISGVVILPSLRSLSRLALSYCFNRSAYCLARSFKKFEAYWPTSVSFLSVSTP